MNFRPIVRSLAAAAFTLAASVGAQDPRVGLKAGYLDAGSAIRHMELLSSRPRPEGFFNPSNIGDLGAANTDFAFRGTTVFLGNFAGFQIWDVANARDPQLVTAFLCPGGQGDVSVHGTLLFMSVEAGNGRMDCGPQGVQGASSPERFRGVRIFDISDLKAPKQVAAVQTCRGSHTHTLVPAVNDASKIYVYVQGTAGVRQPTELEGCTGGNPDENPNTALFRIEIIEVPLARPQDARVVNMPRIFADRATGNIAGLWMGGDHGDGTQRSSTTNQCHDITVYPEVGLAGGACSGNGILLDITDPVNPVRVDEVIDKNFAYWHSATFSNDGRTVIFTDEWGGGTAPRCRDTDRPEWGANALFTIGADKKMTFQGYYKIPAPQTAMENCVAHNGSLVPVPGRDIFVQAWYQGGISVTDFTDPAKVQEIAFFDRGPMSAERLYTGGYWSAYWYNGLVYGSEIGRGLDIFQLTPSEFLTANELEAAALVQQDSFNPQWQTRIVWPAHPSVARAYVDQLARGSTVPAAQLNRFRTAIDAAVAMPAGAGRRQALERISAEVAPLAQRASGADKARLAGLAEVLGRIATAPR
jgi:hypothetical protein